VQVRRTEKQSAAIHFSTLVRARQATLIGNYYLHQIISINNGSRADEILFPYLHKAVYVGSNCKHTSVTPKQIERVKKKISGIKRTLAAEKRKHGDYDDSRGFRYFPPQYFIQLGDYPGGLTYLKWFDKAFPDDMGYPQFLFEWTIILFKTGHLKEAEEKAFQTFCANYYWFDKFFDRPIKRLDIWHSSNLEEPEFTEYLDYSCEQPELIDFSNWLDTLISTNEFANRCKKQLKKYKNTKKAD
jgi:hypothetical protein